jgi:hypothetical protein
MPAGTPAKKTPVRMGKYFSQMLADCPLDVRLRLLSSVAACSGTFPCWPQVLTTE